jgi:release factor glutamine methyltransferase
LKVAEALAAAAIEPREARILLAQASGFSEASLIGFPEREIPTGVLVDFMVFVERRKRGEPVAYIVGHKEFYGLDLAVNPSVLIPRPETELLVDRVLRHDFSSVLELGTGSGAIALAVKSRVRKAKVVAVDSDLSALITAKRNAARLNLEIDFRHGRWFEPVSGERFDVLVSNPPYVAEGDPHLAELAFEPRSALVAGPDGLAAIREIARAAPAHLLPGGRVFLEHGLGQDAAVRTLLVAAGLEAVRTWPDLAGIARVTGGKVKS